MRKRGGVGSFNVVYSEAKCKLPGFGLGSKLSSLVLKACCKVIETQRPDMHCRAASPLCIFEIWELPYKAGLGGFAPKRPMDNARKLFFIKVVHTLIWAFYVLVIGYVVYAGITDRVSTLAWIAIGLVVFEGLVLLFNEWHCPLTLVGRRYTDNASENFDIFLPQWLARNNKIIFTAIFAVGVVLVVWRSV